MAPDLTIVHVRPRTEAERLRDLTSPLGYANSPIHPISSKHASLSPLSPVTPVTPVSSIWGATKNTSRVLASDFFDVPSTRRELGKAKENGSLTNEEIGNIENQAFGSILYNADVEEKAAEELGDGSHMLSPVSYRSESGHENEGHETESVRESMGLLLSPDKKTSLESTKAALFNIKDSIKGDGKENEALVVLIVDTVFETMKNNFNNELVQERGCIILSKICRDSIQIQEQIVLKGGVAILIIAMKHHPKAVGVQSRVITALLCLTTNSIARAQIVDHRGAELISWAMKEFPDAISILKNGSTCLCNLAFGSEENKRRIGKIGGIDAVISSMNRFVDDSDIQARCCLALRNLTCGFRTNQWIAGRGRAMEAILRSMESMSGNKNVLYQGCVALANICANEPENRARACELGAARIVVGALRRNLENAALVEHGLTLFRNLSIENEENRKEIGNQCGLELILGCMKVHRFNKKIVEKGCWALRYLLFSKDIRLLFGTHGGVESLIRVLRDGSEHCDVSGAALIALGNAIYDQLHSKRAVGRHGGIAVILEVMSNHLDSAIIQEHGCRALRNLADSDELNLRLMAESGAIDTVLLSMMGYPDNGYIQEQGCAMLYNMTALDECMKQMKDLEVCKIVARVQSTHAEKAIVQQQAEALISVLNAKPERNMASPRKKASGLSSLHKPLSQRVGRKGSKIDRQIRGGANGVHEDSHTRKLLWLVESKSITSGKV